MPAVPAAGRAVPSMPGAGRSVRAQDWQGCVKQRSALEGTKAVALALMLVVFVQFWLLNPMILPLRRSFPSLEQLKVPREALTVLLLHFRGNSGTGAGSHGIHPGHRPLPGDHTDTGWVGKEGHPSTKCMYEYICTHVHTHAHAALRAPGVFQDPPPGAARGGRRGLGEDPAPAASCYPLGVSFSLHSDPIPSRRGPPPPPGGHTGGLSPGWP